MDSRFDANTASSLPVSKRIRRPSNSTSAENPQFFESLRSAPKESWRIVIALSAVARSVARCAQRMPGSMPFRLRIIFCRLPERIIFIIFCICSNWFRSWFTA